MNFPEIEEVEVHGIEFLRTPDGNIWQVSLLMDHFGADYAHLLKWLPLMIAREGSDPSSAFEALVQFEPNATAADVKMMVSLLERWGGFVHRESEMHETVCAYLETTGFDSLAEAVGARGLAAVETSLGFRLTELPAVISLPRSVAAR